MTGRQQEGDALQDFVQEPVWSPRHARTDGGNTPATGLVLGIARDFHLLLKRYCMTDFPVSTLYSVQEQQLQCSVLKSLLCGRALSRGFLSPCVLLKSVGQLV